VNAQFLATLPRFFLSPFLANLYSLLSSLRAAPSSNCWSLLRLRFSRIRLTQHSCTNLFLFSLFVCFSFASQFESNLEEEYSGMKHDRQIASTEQHTTQRTKGEGGDAPRARCAAAEDGGRGWRVGERRTCWTGKTRSTSAKGGGGGQNDGASKKQTAQLDRNGGLTGAKEWGGWGGGWGSVPPVRRESASPP